MSSEVVLWTELGQKRCRRCGRALPIIAFSKRSLKGNAHRNECRACKAAYDRAYRDKYRQRLAKTARRYYENHREQCIARSIERIKKLRAEHPDQVGVPQEAWRRRHLDRYAEYARTRKARKLQSQIEKIDAASVFDLDGYRCQLCGRKTRPDYNRDHPLFPNLDHIIPLARGGGHVWKNLQCLCRECNFHKQVSVEGQQLRLC